MESKTKIIATIGPASNNKEIILSMIEHHLDIFRLNFSWSNHEEYTETIKIIRESANEAKKNILIMQDLSGPRVQEGSEHHFGGNENDKVITEKDIQDLTFGIEQNVDYIALSFVGNSNDILELKDLIKERGGNQKVIAKIERRIAYTNLDKILEVADGVMVARGDLGNEFPLEEIPFIQHNIIEKANKKGKMVIVATEMLLSMTDKPRPTRAEVSDVAYAIIDGADAVMLSEESARGKYPVEAIEMMEKISLLAEQNFSKIKID